MVELHVQYSLFLHLVPLFFNVHRAPPVSQKIKEGYVLKSCQYHQLDSSGKKPERLCHTMDNPRPRTRNQSISGEPVKTKDKGDLMS